MSGLCFTQMKKIRLIFFLIFPVHFTNAQERLGITNSNYSSVNSIQLNPSSSVDSRVYMQLNLVGLNLYAKTNFAYLPDFNIQQVVNPPPLVRSTIRNKKFLYANASIEALSFVISKRTYGAGFFIRGRGVMDMRHVSYELAGALLNGQGVDLAKNRDLLGQNFKNAKFSSMSWAEYGINFGKMIRRNRNILITAGGNLKYITGISLTYMNILKFDSYNDNKGAFGINDLDAKTLYNQPGWNTGRGLGLDLGITYKVMEDNVGKYYANSKLSNCDFVDYKYKIAFSLRDAGYIRFKGNTTQTSVNGSGHYDPTRVDTTFIKAIQHDFNSNTKTGSPILASLPTALTGQFDKNFDNYIYLNVTVVKNLVPTRITGVQGPDLFSICPRFEMRQMEVALPLTFQKFIYPQLGLGLRFRSLVIGVDNIFPVFMKVNTYGINFYFSLAVSLFRNSACDTKRAGVSDCPRYKKTGKSRPKRRKNFSSKNHN
jgi:hypothetical protein